MVRFPAGVGLQSGYSHATADSLAPHVGTKLGARQLPAGASDYQAWKHDFVQNRLFSIGGIAESFGISLTMQLAMRRLMSMGFRSALPLAATMALASSSVLTAYQVLRHGLEKDQIAGQFVNSFIFSAFGIYLGVKMGFSRNLAKELAFEETAQAALATGLGYALEGVGLRGHTNMSLGERLKMEYAEGAYFAGMSRASRPVAAKIEQSISTFYNKMPPASGLMPVFAGGAFLYDRVLKTDAAANSAVQALSPAKIHDNTTMFREDEIGGGSGRGRSFKEQILRGIPNRLPKHPGVDESIPQSPARRPVLTQKEQVQAVWNALRYFPQKWHRTLATEFAQELAQEGHIYMHRFRPRYPMFARKLDAYPGQSEAAKAIQLMIQNNLDPKVAQFPHHLYTYGGNGAVFQNWAQYLRTMELLAKMTDEQTLVLHSGHPVGLFPSRPNAPRVALVNGMALPRFYSLDDFEWMNAMGVSSYGQMTAGSFMYIGPQGIVHGTTLTLLNAARLHLGISAEENLAGKVFVTSGLGGMSGAQGKAARVANAVGVIAEVNPAAAQKRLEQGWVDRVTDDLDEVARIIEEHRGSGQSIALGYVGNVVDLLEYLVKHKIKIDLASDQTSLHNPYGGGYYPQGLSFADANTMMRDRPEQFKQQVHQSLIKHVEAVNQLAEDGTYFWDYGNRFLDMARVANADIMAGDRFRYPSYFEDIMGPICFDYGFGPFRWVCTSNLKSDLQTTDRIAMKVLRELAAEAPPETKQQYLDNLRWIEEAEKNQLVVGSKARILYSDVEGRTRIAKAFNEAIREGQIKGSVVLGRDHHDVSGTDAWLRETADIKDGSQRSADMAVMNAMLLGVMGASWISLHRGGGTGVENAVNGGFGMVLDGSKAIEDRIDRMTFFDVMHGITRRSRAGHAGAVSTVNRIAQSHPSYVPTPAHFADRALVERAVTSNSTLVRQAQELDSRT